MNKDVGAKRRDAACHVSTGRHPEKQILSRWGCLKSTQITQVTQIFANNQ
jgi:hypothetical protein